MIIPIRCFSCGKPLAQLWKEYKEKMANKEDPKQTLDDLGLDRYCCRAAFLGQAEMVELVNKFKKF
jgi:DNA-directed RNA polymerase subunit N